MSDVEQQLGASGGSGHSVKTAGPLDPFDSLRDRVRRYPRIGFPHEPDNGQRRGQIGCHMVSGQRKMEVENRKSGQFGFST